MPSVVILGGTGVVGTAVAERLLASGWSVLVTSRTAGVRAAALRAAGAVHAVADRHDRDQLRSVLADGTDVVVDCAGYTAAHSRLLVEHAAGIGSVVFVSSKAVYADAAGRHSNSAEPPDFGGPVREDQPTLPPTEEIPYDSAEGYGPNKVAAERVLLDAAVPVSVLRPSRVHGVGAGRSREWAFVKRVLDRRPYLLLAGGGRGANHPTAAVNLAALVETCAAAPGDRVLNAADPDAPDGRAIARAVADHLAGPLGHRWEEVLLDGDAPADLGVHPWHTVPPFLLDTTAATRLGYEPAGRYAATVAPELDRLVAAARAGDPDGVLPAPDDPYFARYLDYATEDRWLATR